MKGLILCFALCATVNFCGAASTYNGDNELMEISGKPFNNPETEHAYEASGCKCPKFPRPVDCSEVLANGENVSGIYTIYPRSRESTCDTLQVYCDMETDGGGWTVIQRRGAYGNGENYFTKNWQTYKKGFGSLKKEFWLGNDNIHAITNQAAYSARFDLRKVNGNSAFALYDTFWIDDEALNYRLHLQEYSGTAGNPLLAHNLNNFYTKDKPNLPQNIQPDKRHEGGWWMTTFPSTNLNGLNKQGQDKQKVGNGIVWYHFGQPDFMESMGTSEIKLRQKKFN